MTERTIFLAALDIDDPSERAAYVDRACGADAGLRGQVENLLKAHGQSGEFMDQPAPALVATIDQPSVAERPGVVVGAYKLLEQIGEGGFGVVFMAEQTHPVRRKVALKVLKPGMDTRQVVARFEAERQALAIMDHPNIAKVFDGGATPSGRPYFVMELVKGVPVTDFCDQNQLTPSNTGLAAGRAEQLRVARMGTQLAQWASSVQRPRRHPTRLGVDDEGGPSDGRGPLAHADHAVGVEAAGRPMGSRHRRRRPRARRAPSQRHRTGRSGGVGVALDVDERLLRDAPHLPLLQDRQPARVSVRSCVGKVLRSRTRSRNASSVSAMSGLRHVGAQVVERVAHLADDPTHVVAQLSSGSRSSPLLVRLDDAVELEGQVGERLADAVVEVAGDAGALLVGADGAQAAEPAGVVDGEGGGLDEAGEQLDVRSGEVVGLAVLDRDQADRRAPCGRTAYRPEPAIGEPRPPGGEEVLLADEAA